MTNEFRRLWIIYSSLKYDVVKVYSKGIIKLKTEMPLNCLVFFGFFFPLLSIVIHFVLNEPVRSVKLIFILIFVFHLSVFGFEMYFWVVIQKIVCIFYCCSIYTYQSVLSSLKFLIYRIYELTIFCPHMLSCNIAHFDMQIICYGFTVCWFITLLSFNLINNSNKCCITIFGSIISLLLSDYLMDCDCHCILIFSIYYNMVSICISSILHMLYIHISYLLLRTYHFQLSPKIHAIHFAIFLFFHRIFWTLEVFSARNYAQHLF